MRQTCRYCKGSRMFIKFPCTECEGKGQTVQRKTVTVPVPAGTFRVIILYKFIPYSYSVLFTFLSEFFQKYVNLYAFISSLKKMNMHLIKYILKTFFFIF